jgi:hypothetical protein
MFWLFFTQNLMTVHWSSCSQPWQSMQNPSHLYMLPTVTKDVLMFWAEVQPNWQFKWISNFSWEFTKSLHDNITELSLSSMIKGWKETRAQERLWRLGQTKRLWNESLTHSFVSNYEDQKLPSTCLLVSWLLPNCNHGNAFKVIIKTCNTSTEDFQTWILYFQCKPPQLYQSNTHPPRYWPI